MNIRQRFWKSRFCFQTRIIKQTRSNKLNKKIIDKKLSTLEENNKNLNKELKLSKAKNDNTISKNQKHLTRLEKFRKYRLKDSIKARDDFCCPKKLISSDKISIF